MATPDNIFVVPIPGKTRSVSLMADCKLVTHLVRKVVEAKPELPLEDAFEGVKRNIRWICEIDWDSMMPVENT